MPRSRPSCERIPIQFRQAVYYLGLDPDEIVEVREISYDGPTFDVHLRKSDLEWHGHLRAPAWSPHPPVCRIEDLVNNTKDCSACKGSGKVKNV
jgi:hypothetical protein